MRLQFYDTTLDFTRAIHLNLSAKFWIEEARAHPSSILISLLITVERVHFCKKCQKQVKLKNSRLCFNIFIIEGILIAGVLPVPSLGGAGGRAPPLTTACAPPHFVYSKYCFWNITLTARQQTIMEKNNYVQTYSFLIFCRFFAKLLASNCCTYIWSNSLSD